MRPVFSVEEVRQLEHTYPEGLSVAAVVELLRERGVELAEATFRKYVQLGLLPRSRRVGRKGKHRGSHGLYPASCVGRVAEIRQLMEAGYTLEEIQHSPVMVSVEVDAWRRAADDLLARIEAAAERTQTKASLPRRLQALRTQLDAVAAGIEAVARDVGPSPGAETTSAAARTSPAPRSSGRLSSPRREATRSSGAKVSKQRSGVRPGQGR